MFHYSNPAKLEKMTLVSEKTAGGYNPKRFTDPYIAILDAVTGRALSWGSWAGEAGEDGMLEIEIPALGAFVLMKGQKDKRGKKSWPEYSLYVNGEQEEYWSSNKLRVMRLAREYNTASQTV